MAEIETVLFDLDNTLVRYRRSPGELLATAFETVGVEPLFPVEAYYERFDEFATQTDTIDELRSACFATLASEEGYETAIGRDVAAAFSKERDHSNVELLPGAQNLLEQYSTEYNLGIVTNGSPDSQQAKIAAVELEQWVETVVFAGHETPVKPSPEPFEQALAHLSASPERTVHIGDSLESDIQGAKNAGLTSVWLTPEEKAKSTAVTYTIRSLSELLVPPWSDS